MLQDFMEKIGQTASNKKHEPSFLLYKLDVECNGREHSTPAYADSDSMIGWETPDVQPKVVSAKKKKSKRATENNVDRKLLSLYHDGLWEESVETYSYRYVPNNGCYRAIKAQMAQPKSNVVQRKLSPTTGVLHSSEQKTLQREISKDLRKQFQALIERNRGNFKQRKPSSVVSDYLEDEEDYKSSHVNNNKAAASVSVPSVHEKVLIYPDGQLGRFQETQSAHPPVIGRLEDLLINKRCSTNLEKIHNLEQKDVRLDPPDKSWIKADKPHSKSVPSIQTPFNRIHMASTDEVEALAKQTFTNCRGPMEPLRASRSLGPVDKVPPSLREVYDNSKAVQELMKFGHVTSQPVNINVSSFSSSRPEHSQPEPLAKPLRSKNTASVGPGVTSNFRTAKFSDLSSRSSKVSEMINIDVDNPNSTFQAFLPSISGKRIATKISSLR